MPVKSSAIHYGDPVDSFLYSTTMPLLPTQTRANCLAQMEILRQAGAYKCRMFGAPDELVQPIDAHSQLETQCRMIPGTYIWGIMFDAAATGDPITTDFQAEKISILVTEAATEIPLFSDYIQSVLFVPDAFNIPNGGGLNGYSRAPIILTQPFLVKPPGQINVEIYNDNGDQVLAQLVLYCAEPIHSNPTIVQSNRRPAYGRVS